MVKKRNPFEFKAFTIHQTEVSLPVTTDACLYAGLTNFHNPKKILDLGCGTGVLMFMMHQKYPDAQIVGIDFHEKSVEITDFNICFNRKETHLKVEHSNWWEFAPQQKFDAIICNPPFFENQLPSQKESKRNARHTNGYALADLLEKATDWLEPMGEISFLLPHTEIDRIQNQWNVLKNQTLTISEFQKIKSKETDFAHLSRVKFTFAHIQTIIIPDHVIYNNDMKFTEATRQVLAPFLQERAMK